jgi:hypothetical protein
MLRQHAATRASGLRFIGIGSDATLLALAGRHAVDCVHRAEGT